MAQAMISGHVLVDITIDLPGRIGRGTRITGRGRGYINLEGGGGGIKGILIFLMSLSVGGWGFSWHT